MKGSGQVITMWLFTALNSWQIWIEKDIDDELWELNEAGEKDTKKI